jgi:membrane protease YdiL (CAAX protease family)
MRNLFVFSLLIQILDFLVYFYFQKNFVSLEIFQVIFFIVSFTFVIAFLLKDGIKLKFQLKKSDFIFIPVFMILGLYLDRIFSLSLTNLTAKNYLINQNVYGAPLYLIRVAYMYILGPIFEEISNRELMFNFLSRKINKYLAVFIVSFVFAISHFRDRSLLQCIVPFFASLMLFGLLFRYKDWKICALFHILLNSSYLQ